MSEPVTTNKLKVPFIQFVLEHKEKWEYPNIFHLNAFMDPSWDDYSSDSYIDIDLLENEREIVKESYGDVSILYNPDEITEAWVNINTARRPIVLMRGTPVTEDQALDIISHTDRVFHCAYHGMDWEQEKMFNREYKGGLDFDNNWFLANVFPDYSGWCHPDGTIGITSIASKYPQLEDVLMELGRYISAFPYLNFVAIYTGWNEIPDSLWNVDYNDITNKLIDEAIRAGLSNSIMVGFWVHDKTIEVLNSVEAYQKYNEMESLMDASTISRVGYDSIYMIKHAPYPADYLSHCIEKYSNETLRTKNLLYMWIS